MIKKVAITAAATAGAIGLAVGPASAAGAITVAGGGAYTAAASSTVTLTAGVPLTCDSATATGTVTPGSYTTPAQIGTITSTGWTNCRALGLSSTVSQSGTWQIWATGTPVGGVTPGEIRNVDATINIGGGACTVHVTGTAGGIFTNGTQHLTLNGTGNLTVTHTGPLCIGVGSSGSFVADYLVSAASPITIS